MELREDLSNGTQEAGITELTPIGKFHQVKVHLEFSFRIKNNIFMDREKVNTFFQVIKLLASSYDE
ncbi:hypothetical protein [Proteiniphilum sp. X52]|uniref:hypothetical protein n=1 Tax=Proteiniphilum sp. X52 TaxID=2382159 RepID=UPI001627BC35|nr:hypothetical protein [Proteiniphilum sp. X52]